MEDGDWGREVGYRGWLGQPSLTRKTRGIGSIGVSSQPLTKNSKKRESKAETPHSPCGVLGIFSMCEESSLGFSGEWSEFRGNQRLGHQVFQWTQWRLWILFGRFFSKDVAQCNLHLSAASVAPG